ncbi:MAG: hypothetical protein JWO08_4127 [Verrucomicrobiaceae bacterium]|nr:hypothetical protein [Verrucomicrobiaceae bacterium]
MEFLLQPTKENMRMLILWWVALCCILLWNQWRNKRSVGLPLAYVAGLSVIHLTGALAYAMEYYQPRSAYLLQGGASMQNTFLGFFVSVIGLAAFVLGCILCSLLFPNPRPNILKYYNPKFTTELPGTLLLISLLFFFFLRPILNRIPSLSSIASAGSYLSVVSITFFLREAYQKKNTSKFYMWLAATTLFPAVTVISMGFAGFGILAALTVWAFTFYFYRPRWLSTTVVIVFFYLGLSLYINYMRERDDIRESVWQLKGLSSRVEKAVRVFTNFQLFNAYNQSHLEMVDIRLNQNDFVGKAVIYIQSGRVEAAQGGTLYAAALSIIPRILWPGKPATGGSGSLVARFTGVKVAEGTSMGVGQVLEFYVNWKMDSVIIGFLLFGMVMRYIDQASGDYLAHGDLWSCARWLLPGTGMLIAGGSMAEVVGSVAGNAVFVYGLHRFLFAKYYDPNNVMQPGHTGRGSRIPRKVS